MKELMRYKRVIAAKRGIAAVFILLCTLLVECAFNYSALRFGYPDIDISENIALEDDVYSIAYHPKKALYVKQIKLVGDYAKVSSYSFTVTEINEFGKKISKSYSDVTSTWFSEYSTNLNKKISSLEISVPKAKDSELQAVILTNRFEWNKYRMLFVFFVLLMLYCAFFEKYFIEKIEWYFALSATVFGVLIIVLSQPVLVSWDEQIHFQNVYEMASGKDVKWSEAARAIVDGKTPNCNTKAEYDQLRKAMDEKGKNLQYSTSKQSIIPSYSKIAYVPMAIFMKAGMLLQLPFTWLYSLGKIGNLLLYVIGMFFVIRMTKRYKLLLVYIAMMPTIVFLASSYSYDTFLNVCMTAGSVLWVNALLGGKEKSDTGAVIAMIVLFSIGCSSKAIYIPLLLLVLATPCFWKMKVKNRILVVLGVFAVALMVTLTFILPLVSSAISGDLSYAGDLRGGDTSPIKQALSMLRHPVASIKLVMESVLQANAFIEYTNTTNYFIGNQIFLWLGRLGAMPVAWNIVILPVFFILMLYDDQREQRISEIKMWQRIYGFLIFGGTIVLVWLSMYLSFTEVGKTEIIGVQPRYFISLIYFGTVLFGSKKIKVEAEHEIISRIAIVSVLIFWVFAISCLLFKNRLL